MNVIDLFSGTGSSTKPFEDAGDVVVRVELNPETGAAEIYDDILNVTPDQLRGFFDGPIDFLWASPPCTAFSVASIGTHWTGGHRAYIPKTEAARHNQKLVEHTRWLIDELKPAYWVIENPRGVLRKLPVVKDLHRDTVWYCQYGDERAKPTDLWNNLPYWWSPRSCRNGAPDHVAAPRGAKTGTQGRKGNRDRSMVPYGLGVEIREAVAEGLWEARL